MEKFIQEIYEHRPWYHDFKALGIQTNFSPEKMDGIPDAQVRQTRKNMDQQARKESIIAPYIQMALDRIGDTSNISILDLFCADGYYGFLTQKLAPGSTLTGVDINGKDIKLCKIMASHLDLGPSTFVEDDVYHYVENSGEVDLALCTGGLYHIPDPRRLLDGLRKITEQYLIIQSAITVAHDDPDYYETPNPWFNGWGSLFTNARLLRWIDETGFNIIDSATNARAEPNPRKVGACYALVK
jgi:2-polyprenyl-3-methyl-5-hydroxy-6-metoxy-1,4-benzoquinol methylase